MDVISNATLLGILSAMGGFKPALPYLAGWFLISLLRALPWAGRLTLMAALHVALYVATLGTHFSLETLVGSLLVFACVCLVGYFWPPRGRKER